VLLSATRRSLIETGASSALVWNSQTRWRCWQLKGQPADPSLPGRWPLRKVCMCDRNIQSYDAEQLSRLTVVENSHCQFAANSLKMMFVANSFSWLYRHGALTSARKVTVPVHFITVSNSLSHSQLRVDEGASHHDPLQAASEASWVGKYLEVRPHLLSNLVMCQALQKQLLCHFFCIVAVGTCSRVLIKM